MAVRCIPERWCRLPIVLLLAAAGGCDTDEVANASVDDRSEAEAVAPSPSVAAVPAAKGQSVAEVLEDIEPLLDPAK